MRWGHTVNALGSQGKCAGVPAHVLWGRRPRAPTVGTGRNALFGRGHPRNFPAGKHLEVLARPTKTAQQMFSTQRVARHRLRAFDRGPCWALGRAVSGVSVHSVFRLTCSSLPCWRRAARRFLGTPGCFQLFPARGPNRAHAFGDGRARRPCLWRGGIRNESAVGRVRSRRKASLGSAVEQLPHLRSSRHTPSAVTGGRHTACACYGSREVVFRPILSPPGPLSPEPWPGGRPRTRTSW